MEVNIVWYALGETLVDQTHLSDSNLTIVNMAGNAAREMIAPKQKPQEQSEGRMEVTNPNVVCFDVDETLVHWTWEPGSDTVIIETPWHTQITVSPNHATIGKLIDHSKVGHYVIVWSQGGNDWAKTVIDNLGLAPYVNTIATKPKWYYDDLPADAWMHRVDPEKLAKKEK